MVYYIEFCFVIGVFVLRSVEDRLKSYEPLWENWTYTGEFLGEGAMSSVFEIQSMAMGMRELAALKIVTIKKGPGGEVVIPENTINEIKILRTLSSCPNIVQYHDSTQRKIYDKNNELICIDILIKMEKLHSLSETSKLSENQIVKLAKDMCTALIHASEYGIIHRDIKPQNIFVSDDGTYKLGDFGIAKIVSDFSGHYTMNIGTLAYTAPEIQNNATGRYDITSDIYSLGLVLYVLLNNGYLPFAGSIPIHDAITKRFSGAPFPSPANGSKKLKAIVMRACNYDYTRRYSTPAEMLEDLELLTSGGKKFVPDPFATLDANLDVVVDIPDSLYGSKTPAVSEVSSGSKSSSLKGSGLKINMKKTVYYEPGTDSAIHESDDAMATVAWKGTPSSGAAGAFSTLSRDSVSSSEAESREPSVHKSGLKINLKSRTPSETAPESAGTDDNAAVSTSRAKSGLKINLKGKSPTESNYDMSSYSKPVAPKEKASKKDDEDFFFTPASL